ncbi:hypothetical protein GTU79_14725 [Sodalis ligni]|nr:hypothetical protein GTU79_14725 [Sodalis ligni]
MAFESKGGGAACYGSVALYLREKTKGNMTFTSCDSGALSTAYKYNHKEIQKLLLLKEICIH